jgi:hypothetical protein
MMFADEEHATPGAEREGTHGPRLENANSVRSDGLTFEGFIAGKAFDSNSIIADLDERDAKIVSLSIDDLLRLWPKPNGFRIAITKSLTSICRGHPTEWPSGCLSAPEAEEPQHRLRDRARPILRQTFVRPWSPIFGPSPAGTPCVQVARFGDKPFPAATAAMGPRS